MWLRLTLDVLLFVSVLILPAWVTVLIAIVLMSYFSNFYEAIIAGIFLDGLYSLPSVALLNVQLVFTVMLAVVYMVVSFLKPYIRIHPRA